MFGYRIKCELERLNLFLVGIIGGAFLLLAFAVWCASSSPLYVLRLASDGGLSLPMWLFGLLDLLSFVFCGAALGAVLGVKCACEVEKYRGAFYFIIAVALAYMRHVVLFSYLGFFLSMLISVLVCFFEVVAIINFRRVSRVGSVLAVLGGLWSLYMLFFCTALFFFV